MSAGVSNLTENSTWSQGDAAHALYMVKTGDVAHQENPSSPYYTVAGDTAARNSNIQVSSTTSTTDDQAIDWWMGAPFHAMGMMDPRLTQTGFGSYRDGTTSPWQEGAALDTIQGNSFAGGQYPVYFPGNGATEPLTTYGGNEFPDPLQACPGYSAPTGLPVFIEVGGNVNTTAGPIHSLTGNGVALNHCVIDSTNSAVSSYLYTRGGVIVVPQQPLQNGVRYVVALTVNGVPYTWSFTVGPLGASVDSVSPNAGPSAGGTTVTITGAGFSNGMTSVKFGPTSAASFSVVNDTTVTAVSPARAAGTVDVTVTTAGGTSAASPLDQFTFGACVSVTASAAPVSPSTPGTSITFTGIASGCSNPLYQFWILTPGSTWQIVQAYSSTATYNWNTTGLPAGSYMYTVWVRDASSAGVSCNNYGCKDSLFPGTTYTLTSTTTPCLSVTAPAAPASPQAAGTAVTFTGSASGCPHPLYQFWILAPGSTWQITQAYSATATYNWSTTGLPAGSYMYTVWVRDASSAGASCNNYGCKDALFPGTAYVLSTTSTPCTSVTGPAAPASPQAAGTAVTFTGSALSCPHPLYQFWILAPGSTWQIVQAYSSTATYNWSTTGLPAGTYLYTVWVRDASSAGASCNNYGCKDALFPGTAYTLTTTPCTSVTASASPASPQLAGTAVTLAGVASGCPHPIYQFWILAPGSTWQIVQAYSTTATYNWSTTGLPAGSYMYTVWVRDSGSTGASCNNYGCKDALFPGTAYTLDSPCTSVTASASPATPQGSGTAVTFTGAAMGCPRPLYQFWILAPGSHTWQIVQAYSSVATFTWNTSGLLAGSYLYTVWARDSSSSGTSCSYLGCNDAFFPGTAYTLGTTPCSSVTDSASPTSPRASGTAITFTAVASSCPHPLYQFWILAPGSHTWQIVQAYASAATFTWNTTGLLAGSYLYTVWARDSGSSGTSCSYLGCNDAFFPGTAYTLS